MSDHATVIPSIDDEDDSDNVIFVRRHRPYSEQESTRNVFLTDRLPRMRANVGVLGISATALSLALGLDRHALDVWETEKLNRQRPVPMKWLTAMADNLGVSEHVLIHGTGQEQKYLQWVDQNAFDHPSVMTRGEWCDDEPPDMTFIEGAVRRGGLIAVEPVREKLRKPVSTGLWPTSWVFPQVRPTVCSMPFMPSPAPGRPGSTTFVRQKASVRGGWRYGSLLDPTPMNAAA